MEATAARERIVLLDVLRGFAVFGVGFFLQLERARSRAVPLLAIYLRRLAALFLIAALAIVAGLGAHILIDYSIFGFLLLLWRRSTGFLLAAAVACFVIGVVSDNIEVVGDLIATDQSDRTELVDDGSSPEALAEIERDRVYREGSFKEIANYRGSSA